MADQTQLYQALLKVQSDIGEAVLIVDGVTEKIIYANEALQQLTGYSKDEILGFSSIFEGLVPPEHWAELKDRMRRRIEGQVLPTQHETTILAKDGRRLLMEFAAKVVTDDDHPQVVVMARDITARRQVERQTQFQANLMANVSDAIIATDVNQHITSWNKAAEILYGKSAAAVLGRPVSEILDATLPIFEPEVMAQLQAGQTWHGEIRQIRADGSPVEIISSVAAIIDQPDEVVGYVTVNHDITERKRLEQQREEFLAIASHELKTPVTSAKAFAQLLERKLESAGDSEGLRYADRIDAQLSRLSALIGELLDASQIQTGQMQLNLEPLDWREVVAAVIDDMREDLQDHQVVLIGQRPLWVKADRLRMTRVIQNLLSNAAKYSPPGTAIMVRLGRANGRARLMVQDFGQGIKAEDKAHIFERFWRGQVDHARGLGLGLFICAEIMRSHGGEVTVASVVGWGSTFTCYLPLSDITVD